MQYYIGNVYLACLFRTFKRKSHFLKIFLTNFLNKLGKWLCSCNLTLHLKCLHILCKCKCSNKLTGQVTITVQKNMVQDLNLHFHFVKEQQHNLEAKSVFTFHLYTFNFDTSDENLFCKLTFD